MRSVSDVESCAFMEGTYSAEAMRARTPDSEPDSFDAIVTEMRAKRSDEMIEVLYKQLFALPEWFFICDPYEERAPAQWVFPDVADGSPAVLAFTSRERATRAAVELGLYDPGAEIPLMPAPVDAAVGWITSSDFHNEWLNFNQTRNDFPLYVDDVTNLFNLA